MTRNDVFSEQVIHLLLPYSILIVNGQMQQPKAKKKESGTLGFRDEILGQTTETNSAVT
jgi:hypothetical protein